MLTQIMTKLPSIRLLLWVCSQVMLECLPFLISTNLQLQTFRAPLLKPVAMGISWDELPALEKMLKADKSWLSANHW